MLLQAIVRYVLRDCYSLNIGNSYWAAFSLILAINIGLGPVAKLINFEVKNVENLQRVQKGGTYFIEDQWNPDYDQLIYQENNTLG